ncbi:MAG: hypoxanthine phosphoribosyltransferase [Deferribacteraceae bacterium]|jgi:hypoxanthine phosphoribosyltransferase|nr:hypoxanthine phosphoribosyltransferase [Deferribacteraceae bacterium]
MSYSITTFISEEEIKDKVSELGRVISSEYRDKPLFVIGVMTGSVLFFADLVREIDYNVEMGFIATSSYADGSSSTGKVQLTHDITKDLTGKDVLIVDDIIDSGNTAKFLLDTFRSRGAASVKFCALLDKPSRRQVANVSADYLGFTVPDKFIVGYGLDYAGKHRNLKYLATIEF